MGRDKTRLKPLYLADRLVTPARKRSGKSEKWTENVTGTLTASTAESFSHEPRAINHLSYTRDVSKASEQL